MLSRESWQARAAAHAARVDGWTQPHLERRRRGESHPVHDFMFDYYSHSPAALRRWHPGYGVSLIDAAEYADLRGYTAHDDRVSISPEFLRERQVLAQTLHRLLVATAGRAATYSCFGLHEWAMVHQAPATRHPVPLRLGAHGTDQVVESHRIACTHFDAFRFFTPSARPLNTLSPGREDRSDFEQPGCLHATMDLYKHAFRLSPLVPSELVVDCFELACEVREVDMRASPYDLRGFGYEPIAIETAQGKNEYVGHQRAFAQRAEPLRSRLIEHTSLLTAHAQKNGRHSTV